jgi:hypothetical protein
MPDPITIGHLLMALGLLALLGAAGFLLTASRWRGPGHGRGTPGYARARLDRRKALYAAVLGAILFVAGCFTPLAELPLAGAGA